MPPQTPRHPQPVESTPSRLFLERRSGLSELEQGARTLRHAVEHLQAERRTGAQYATAANRDAIVLLCAAAQRLTSRDRREATRRYTLGWLWDAITWTR